MGGCNGSGNSAKSIPVETNRRRLSVSHGHDGGEEPQTDGADGDRGLIQALTKESILELASSDADGGRRRVSICSKTDQGKTSFANKAIVQQSAGRNGSVNLSGLGFTCRKGLKPDSPNQDSFFALRLEPHYSVYGVFDGHGQKGHDVSEFVKVTLPKLLLRDPRWNEGSDKLPALCKDVFKKMQDLIAMSDQMNSLNAQLAGTTATIAIHDHQINLLTVAHVADSTAVLGKSGGQAIQLTRDHKPDLRDERDRIEKAGGRVLYDGYANHRVYAKEPARYPGLNMSRCLGDLMGHQHCGITCEPEVSQRSLTSEDTVLLLCSDGVWEFMSPTDAVALVSPFKPGEAMKAAETLARQAWDRWIREEGGVVVDDITVVLVQLAETNKDT